MNKRAPGDWRQTELLHHSANAFAIGADAPAVQFTGDPPIAIGR
jgi:hypothetical protein